MKQAIETRYFGPTNTKGARIVVTAQAGRLVLGWNDALEPHENHLQAAKEFAAGMRWAGQWIGGANTKGDGYTFVCVDWTGPAGTFESPIPKEGIAT